MTEHPNSDSGFKGALGTIDRALRPVVGGSEELRFFLYVSILAEVSLLFCKALADIIVGDDGVMKPLVTFSFLSVFLVPFIILFFAMIARVGFLFDKATSSAVSWLWRIEPERKQKRRSSSGDQN